MFLIKYELIKFLNLTYIKFKNRTTMESKELTPGGADLNLSPDASPITAKN